jgi:alanyl-tRNA synthetase
VFRVTGETSSAANVRRIEALTGPAAVQLLREHDREFAQIVATLRTSPENAADTAHTRELNLRAIEKIMGMRAEQIPVQLKAQMDASVKIEGTLSTGVDIGALIEGAQTIVDVPLVCAHVDVANAKALLNVVDRIKGKLPGDGVVILGAAIDGRVSLVVSVAPKLVQRGLKAGEIVKVAAQVVGGGGGGRDTMAQAGGRDPEKLEQALAAAQSMVEATLGVGA